MNILFQFFLFVKDFRSKRGQRYELTTIIRVIMGLEEEDFFQFFLPDDLFFLWR